MNTSDQYHQAVLEALSAFVREGTTTLISPPPTDLPTDIQAALTVISRRSPGLGIVDLDNTFIYGANLARANLTDAKLSGAKLFDSNLTDASLSRADLSRADLSRANLSGANLTDANLSGFWVFGNTTGFPGHTNLTRANLSGANLTRADLFNADLTGANLTRAYLTGADLTRADLTDARIGQNQLDAACGSEVKLPPGLTLKPCPPKGSP
jgi:uncharacterized protein YjbI with pentapeptide repeats